MFLDLVNYVHRGVTTHDLPQAGATQLSQALATYKTGSPMVFGKLTVSQQGVYDGQEMLPWDQIKSVQINDDRMTIIKKKDNDLAWSIYQVSQVQRASLFMDLVNSISKGQL